VICQIVARVCSIGDVGSEMEKHRTSKANEYNKEQGSHQAHARIHAKHTHTRPPTHTHTYTHTPPTHTHTHTHTRTHTPTHTHTHTHTHICPHTPIPPPPHTHTHTLSTQEVHYVLRTSNQSFHRLSRMSMACQPCHHVRQTVVLSPEGSTTGPKRTGANTSAPAVRENRTVNSGHV